MSSKQFGFVCWSLFCLSVTLEASATDLFSLRPEQIERYERRRSGQRLEVEKGVAGKAGFVFTARPWQRGFGDAAELVDASYLPSCRSAEVRRRPVYHYSPGSERFDFVYYAGNDSTQRAQAAKLGSRAIPYQAILRRDPNTQQVDRIQVFARFVQIPCLPARFRFVYEGRQRYVEYRLGERAWD